MEKNKGDDKFNLWLRRFIFAISAVFLYWINENFIHLSIHDPTCLLIIGYFFMIMSLIDIILCRILKIRDKHKFYINL